MKKLSLGIALRTSLIYMAVAGLWIVLSDRVLDLILPTQETYINWQTIKGLLFVTVTGTLLFLGLRAQLQRLQQEKNYRQQTETYFNNLMAVSTDAVISIDRDQAITYFNLGAEKIFGYEADEALGRPLDILLAERHAAPHRYFVRQFGEGPDDSVVMRQIIARRKNGEEFTAEATATKYREGDTLVFTVILRDVEERERAENLIRRHLARANALTETAARINENLDLPIVLNSICEELANALGVQMVIVALLDSRENIINLAASHGLVDEDVKIIKPVPAEKYIRTAQGLGPVAFLPELAEASQVFDVDLFQELGVHAIAVSNMFEDQNFFGSLIAMTTDAGRAFDEDDTQLMKGLADQAASAIKNASLYSKARQRLENLHALRAIDMAITGSLDLHVVMRVLLDQVISQLSVEAACVYLLDEYTMTLEFHSGRGIEPALFAGTRIRLGEEVAGKIALDQRPVCIKNISQARLWTRPQLPDLGLTAYCGVPLIAKGRCHGVLEVFSAEDKSGDPEWVDLLETLAGQAAIAIETYNLFSELKRSNNNLVLAYDRTLEGWSRALDLRDEETEGHTQRVTEMAVHLAGELGLRSDVLLQIRRGGLLHDIGKLGVPDRVLLKEGPLDDREWELMKLHPVHAYNLLRPITYLREALEIPYCHHEHWDGSGYPRGLAGDEIPLSARIFAVIDVWDALTSDRPYRKAWPQERALEYIHNKSGTQFDPEVVEAFLKMVANGHRSY